MRRVVLVSGNQAQAYQGALAASGFEAVTVPSYRQARMEVEAGAVAVVVCPEAPAWGGLRPNRFWLCLQPCGGAAWWFW